MNRKRRPLLLAVGYFIFLFVIFEGSARLVFSIPQLSWRLFADEDGSWRREWSRRHRGSSRGGIYYTFDVYDPVRGWVVRPRLKATHAFGGKTLNTNSKGLRGTQEFEYERKAGTPRILILGDSFTFGDEVSDNETYAHYLREMLPGTEVINMGVHGYGHDQMLIHFKQDGVQYKPDLVLLGFVSVDMPRNLLGFRDFAKPRYRLRDGQLTLTGVPVPTPEEVGRWDWTRPRVLDAASVLVDRVSEKAGSKQRRMEAITEAIVTELAHTAVAIGATPVFVYLPVGAELTATEVPQAERFLYAVCEKVTEARCASTRPRFLEAARHGRRFTTDGHWDPVVHRIAAEAIQKILRDSGFGQGTASP